MNTVTSFLPQPSLLCVPRAGRTPVTWLCPLFALPHVPGSGLRDGRCPGIYSDGTVLGPQAVGAQGLAVGS